MFGLLEQYYLACPSPMHPYSPMCPAASSRQYTPPPDGPAEIARLELVNAVREFRDGTSCEDLLRSAVRNYVSALKQSGLKPESMLIQVKRAIITLQAPGDDRMSRRNQTLAVHLIEWCIEDYYGASQ